MFMKVAQFEITRLVSILVSAYHVFKFLSLFRPLLREGGTIYSNGFFLLRRFWPIDIIIVESCEWYHQKARPA